MDMHALVQKETILERRGQNSISSGVLWDMLSLAQKFAASSLLQFGYELTFIRNGDLAIMLCNENIATISVEGEIDSTPNITLRS